MSIHIVELMEYLDETLVCERAEGMESLMGLLRDAYVSHNHSESEAIRKSFRALHKLWEPLPKEHTDAMFAAVCDLCAEYELLAFAQGVRVGMQLMTEIDYRT